VNDIGDTGGSQFKTLTNTLLANVSHYAQNDSLPAPNTNTTNCLYCHNSSANGSKWGNASQVLETSDPPNTEHPGKTATTNSECYNCHGGKPDSFHNETLIRGAGTCRDCHFSYSIAGSKFVNETMYNRSVHGNQSVIDCEDCHTNTSSGTTNHTGKNYLPPESGWKWCECCHAVKLTYDNRTPIITTGIGQRHNLTSKPQYIYYNVSGFEGLVNFKQITNCTVCHDAMLYNEAVKTYNRTSGRDCRYCHSFPDLLPGGD
jgi:hypothetical protein